MSELFAIIVIFFYLVVLILISHYLRTWAYGRHEAITFECSASAAFISLFLIWYYGASLFTVLLFVITLVMLAANAFAQWHFYMKLQGRIDAAFRKKRAACTNAERKNAFAILRAMASIAIMPSFSRSIEESRVLNNQAGFIGLLKTLMKRQRFQKKKYLMRDCFSDNLNLLGPCKPVYKADESGISSKPEDPVSEVVHPEDFALSEKDERTGLLTFDLLGFGAMLLVLAMLLFIHFEPAAFSDQISHGHPGIVFLLVSSVLLTVFISFLRHYAFARYESVFYELTFGTFLIASLMALHSLFESGCILPVPWMAALITLLIFVILSAINKSINRKFLKELNKQFDGMTKSIVPDTVLKQTIRKFIYNLQDISEWALTFHPEDAVSLAAEAVSADTGKLQSEAFSCETPLPHALFAGVMTGETHAYRRSDFHVIYRERTRMFHLANTLLCMTVPETADLSARLDAAALDGPARAGRISRMAVYILSVCAFASILLLIGQGLI